MRRVNLSSGLTWESKVGYSRLVQVGRQIYVSGTTATGPDGKLTSIGDAHGQTVQCLRNIESALAQVGSDLSDVVRTRVYVPNMARDWQEVGRGHAELLGEFMPASTMVEVKGLIDPDMLVEVEAEVIKGAGRVVVGERPRIVAATFDEGSDLGEILRSVDLPVPTKDDNVEMLKAYVGGELVGCVGCERYGGAALLRSLVVIRQAKGEGVGRALVEGLIARLRDDGVNDVYLLTADTARYFGYFGFEPVDRADVDSAVLSSDEFAAYAEDEVTVMRHRIR